MADNKTKKDSTETKSKTADAKKPKSTSKSTAKSTAKTSSKKKKDVNEEKTSKKKSKSALKTLGGMLFAKMAKGGAAELRSNADEVNKLNVFPVPDGDTGDNMRMTIESGVRAIEHLDTDDLAKVTEALSKGMLLGARGNSGVILSQFFAGVSKGLRTSPSADPRTLGAALEMGVQQAYTTVMTPTEGTILTVAREAVAYAVERINDNSTIRSFFADLVKEMHASVDRTPDLLPALKEAGVVDSGGAGLFYIMDGLNRVLNGEEIESVGAPIPGMSDEKSAPDTSAFNADSVMTYGYCTELLVQLQNSKCNPHEYDVDALRNFLATLGDSIVAFKTDSIVKLHVHTLTPEVVLAKMREVGEFLTVKIENMSLQHSSLEAGAAAEEEKADGTDTDAALTSAEETAAPVLKKYGIVAVTNGAGVEALFRELGADATVSGGQTNNPSAQEFLEAFDTIAAENIFVLPNNSNIFLAAKQAAEIYEKAKIHVIPTKSIGTGYVALATLTTMELDSEEPESVLAAAGEAIESVVCGAISPAIRDTQINGIEIKNGDTIGIIGKEIVVDDEDRDNAAFALCDYMLKDGRYMMTIFRGKDATEEDCEKLNARITEKYPDVEIYVIDAGQDIYPYIIVAE